MKPIAEALKVHECVRKVVELGYEISYDYRDDKPFLDFQVMHGGRPAGHATLQLVPDTGTLHVEAVEVYDGHKGNGVGNALCVCATLLTGFTIATSTAQSEEGRAFWNQPNRPW